MKITKTFKNKYIVVATLVYMIFFLQAQTFGQNRQDCEKIVSVTYQALNAQSIDNLLPFLSDDFSIAGYTGDAARAIAGMLLKQLNDRVDNYAFKTESRTSDQLALTYEAEFVNAGKRQSTFIFDQNNKLIELDLLGAKMKTIEVNPVTYEKPDVPFIKIPFKQVRNLIIVEAKVNGEAKNFILDNGASSLVFNSHYSSSSDSVSPNAITLSDAATGIGQGGIGGMTPQYVEEFDFYGVKARNQNIPAVDISHFETYLNIAIYGLLGCDVYEGYDLFLDYQNKYITLVKPEYSNDFIYNYLKCEVADEVPFVMSTHLAVVEGKSKTNKHALALALDCGAETNLIDIKLFPDFEKELSDISVTNIAGVDTNLTEAKQGTLNELTLGKTKFKTLNTLFCDISHLNESSNRSKKFDGILGYDIFSKQKTFISYSQKKLMFLD